MNILVTGGLGYIGSHVCVSLLEAGYDVIILDNLSGSTISVRDRIESVACRRLNLVIGDIRDQQCLQKLFSDFNVCAVLHFAGLKSPLESIASPAEYYDNNVCGTLTLVREMAKHDVKTLVFSSSASIYGLSNESPITEVCSANPVNPYGRSKHLAETILGDISVSDEGWKIACLRYFNPVGAHRSGKIGEEPHRASGNLMPLITQVASGLLDRLSIYGCDFDTVDGTGVRDYIHVQDLAEGHIATLNYLKSNPGLIALNLGSGKGVSVLEIIHEFEKVTGIAISHDFVARRKGDVAECWADPSLAEKSIGWKSRLNLTDMCRDAWRWEQYRLQNGS